PAPAAPTGFSWGPSTTSSSSSATGSRYGGTAPGRRPGTGGGRPTRARAAWPALPVPGCRRGPAHRVSAGARFGPANGCPPICPAAPSERREGAGGGLRLLLHFLQPGQQLLEVGARAHRREGLQLPQLGRVPVAVLHGQPQRIEGLL